MKRKRTRAPEEPLLTEEVELEQLSFLELAEKKRQAAWAEDELRYALDMGGDQKPIPAWRLERILRCANALHKHATLLPEHHSDC